MSNIYRKSSLEKLASPDHLDKMVSISSPGTWIVLVAGIVMISALVLWGIFGETAEYIPISGAYIENTNQENEYENGRVVCFALMKNSARINPGMMAKIIPVKINEEEYGYMIGRVVKVSSNYLTEEELVNGLKNKKLSQYFEKKFNGNPVVEVHIQLDKDETKSGYKWSDTRGDEIILENYTLIQGSLILKEEAPAKKILSNLLK